MISSLLPVWCWHCLDNNGAQRHLCNEHRPGWGTTLCGLNLYKLRRWRILIFLCLFIITGPSYRKQTVWSRQFVSYIFLETDLIHDWSLIPLENEDKINVWKQDRLHTVSTDCTLHRSINWSRHIRHPCDGQEIKHLATVSVLFVISVWASSSPSCNNRFSLFCLTQTGIKQEAPCLSASVTSWLVGLSGSRGNFIRK